MEIYLIRHTTPAIQKGVCYGQTDLDTTDTFEQEAASILQHLPKDIGLVYSSPLKRCRNLATYLFPSHAIRYDDRLKEINCGDWEMQLWDAIDSRQLGKWMDDFVNECIPGGESYVHLHDRVIRFLSELDASGPSVAIVAHGGVLRTTLSHFTKTDLKESFNAFAIRYGCVAKLSGVQPAFEYSILHNPHSEKEQHKPSRALNKER